MIALITGQLMFLLIKNWHSKLDWCQQTKLFLICSIRCHLTIIAFQLSTKTLQIHWGIWSLSIAGPEKDFWSAKPFNKSTKACPYNLSPYMSRNQFHNIKRELCITKYQSSWLLWLLLRGTSNCKGVEQSHGKQLYSFLGPMSWQENVNLVLHVHMPRVGFLSLETSPTWQWVMFNVLWW